MYSLYTKFVKNGGRKVVTSGYILVCQILHFHRVFFFLSIKQYQVFAPLIKHRLCLKSLFKAGLVMLYQPNKYGYPSTQLTATSYADL